MQTSITFNSKVEARRVCRRLRDFNVLSRAVDRELRIEVTKHGADRDRDLALRIYNGEV